MTSLIAGCPVPPQADTLRVLEIGRMINRSAWRELPLQGRIALYRVPVRPSA